MARAPVIAVDFLGLSKMPHDSNNQTSPEDHRGRFLEPTLSMTSFQATGFWPAQANVPGNLGNFSTAHERNVQMAGAQNVAPKSKDVPSGSGRYEEGRTDRGSSKPSASVEKTRLDKPLEELSEEDIMQLTREDCRRYLKEKGNLLIDARVRTLEEERVLRVCSIASWEELVPHSMIFVAWEGFSDVS